MSRRRRRGAGRKRISGPGVKKFTTEIQRNRDARLCIHVIPCSLAEMKAWWALLFIPLLTHCGGGFGGTSVGDSPAVLNVSGWDPKEVQRSGDRYSRHNLSTLRRNGALGLIARSAKGAALDDKFADFIQSADREGLLPGAYHFVTLSPSATAQADAFVDRVRSVARSRGLSRRKILLVGDFDTHSSPQRLVDFIQRVEQRTGVTPVVYLENSRALRDALNAATPAQKRVMRRAPYWLALYSPKGTERSMGSEDLTPDELTRQYGVWSDWAMWQYGGVIWQGGRSAPKHYNTSHWRSPRYFGNMAHPMERNVFRGDEGALNTFWDRHGLAWW
jgi:GH25 family lysozyme M1 (1,4-beta-N-acetylmuramidase)